MDHLRSRRWLIVGDGLWPKVVHVLNRGGRFDEFAKGYDGNLARNKYGTPINLYQEKTATTKNSMTGKLLPGVATWLPSPVDSMGRTPTIGQAPTSSIRSAS